MNFFAVNKETTVRSIIMQAQTDFLLFSVKLIEHIFSADNVCSNLWVGTSPRIKKYFFLLSIFVDELLSISKIVTLLWALPLGCKKNPRLSNPVPYPEYLEKIY